MKMMLRKTLALVLAILMVVGMFPLQQAMEVVAASGTEVYFKPNSDWASGGARFAVYYWTSSGNGWESMSEVSSGVYGALIPTCVGFKFVRMNGGTTANNWDNRWNEWSNMSISDISGTKNCYTQSSGTWDNGSGSWGEFTPTTLYVAGSSALTGESWNPNANQMTHVSLGVYQITFKNVLAGNHECKVTTANWGQSWGKDGGSDNYTFSTTGENHVTITFDYATKTISYTLEPVQTVVTYNVTYSGSNITCFGNSTVTAGTAYSATLSAATGYELPDEVTVTVGGTKLTSGYSYDKSTGKVSIEAAKVTGNINIKADGVKIQVEEPDTITLYLDPNMWTVDGGPYAIHYWGGSSGSGDVTMTEGANGIYYAEIPADATNVLFHRNNYGHKTNDLTVPTDGSNQYTITAWDTGDKICPGTWSTYGGSSSEDKDTYYVNTDIVDYLNDTRVNFGQVNGYSSDNQGNWMVQTPGNPVFSYLNHIISLNALNSDGSTKYTYPLYFGNMLYVSSRYGTTYKAFSTTDEYKGYRNGNQISLNRWNTGANVALSTLNAVVQGLVGDELDKYGQLVDPETGEQLFYFDKTSIESWKTSSGSDGKRLMAYYSNLQFPFKTSYDANTGVTTYSYDSTKDTAVYIDYTNYDPDAESNPMIPGSSTRDFNGNRGFFPLNQPGNSGDTSNYGFGVKFTIDFTVSRDGKIVSADGTETPVEFSFTGDDDVWVFIDGKLVLDMGGAHSLAHGSINFQTLSATVENAAQASDKFYEYSHYYNQYGYNGDGEQRENLDIADITTPFPEELAKVFQNEYNTGMSQVHTLTMFYMERAGIESNMSIEFSMSPIPTGLTISKDIENVNPGLNDDVQADDEFSFSVEATKDGDEVTFDGYDLTDHNSVTTDGVITNGNVISGIRGDKYANNFTNGTQSAFSAGTSFVVKEINFDTNKYYSTRWVLYEYSNGYIELDRGDGVEAAFETPANSSGNYALNFINAIETGTLTIRKEYPDTLINTSNMEFTFKILMDVDGTDYQLQPGLTYDLYNGSTLVSQGNISEDGSIKLKAGQTVKINGIPVGTNYKVVEVDDSDLWEVVGSSEVSGTISSDAEVTYTFTNKTSATDLDKVIYVESGTDTYYTLADSNKTITLNSVSTDDIGLNVSISNGKILVNAAESNKKYTFEYAGTYPDGSFVSGTVTVYTYSATVKNYVFDFGLSSDLQAVDFGNGLFQGAVFDNKYAPEGDVVLTGLSGEDNTQTTITTTLNGSINTVSNRYDYEVVFTPVAFMSKIETYSYTVRITAQGKTFDANNPETGCIVTGTIRVMPANSVYYEEFFSDDAGEKIVYSSGVEFVNPDKTLTQDNGNNGNYGYDSSYNGYYQNSNGSVAVMEHQEYAYFTFTGTGFDLISQTNATSAGLAVYVFKGQHSAANLKYVTDLEDEGVTPEDMVFVHTYYTNGSLYQVPVIDVRLDEYATYTVYVQCLKTYNGNSVALDGIRIYNPLENTQYYASGEQNVIFSELRQLLNSNRGDGSNEVNNSEDILRLAGIAGGELFVGTGKQSVVAQALIENPELGTSVTTSADLNTVYKQGPNNEMYLPKNLGVMFTYSVTGSDWTLQLGAKAVTATNDAKSISIYVRVAGSDAVKEVAEITLSTATDMYYDLSQYLGDYSEQGQTYELFIISNSAASNNEFVSLTSVKHAGVTLRSES